MALACVGIDGCFGDDVNGDETRGPETTIQAPAGTLGISFGSDDTSNVMYEPQRLCHTLRYR